LELESQEFIQSEAMATLQTTYDALIITKNEIDDNLLKVELKWSIEIMKQSKLNTTLAKEKDAIEGIYLFIHIYVYIYI
jgi:hypothetical protein